MAAPRRRSYTWLVASLLISMTAAVPLAYLTFPHIYRWRLLGWLDSDDLARRERALQYVMSQAPQDPRVLHGAVARLPRLADGPFVQLVTALNLAGLWHRPTIPDAAWFRWLDPLLTDAHPDARVLAAQRLADLHDLASDDRVIQRLTKLRGDADAHVRLNALAAAAELAGAARFRRLDPTALDALVLDATRDSEPRIARDAYIFVGLLDTASGVSANWREAPPDVAEAIVWAAAVRDHKDMSPRLLAVAASARGEPPAVHPGDWPPPLDALARYETATIDALDIEIAPDTPDMLRLAAVAVTKDPRSEDLQPLFASDEPSMRDLACVVAADRLTPQQQEQLAGELLRSFDDRRKMSGAILCGLTGVRPRAAFIDATTGQALREVDLLPYRLQHEKVWAVQQVLRLAMWMQGEEVVDAQGAVLDRRRVCPALLSTPQDVPLTTVLLAMLHMRDPAALEYLLNPRGEERVDLVELFDQQRWWRVMRRYLPAGHPDFWWWADAELERFQVDVLRNWYLVHRVRIRTEWNSPTGSRAHGEAGQQ